MDYLNRLPRKSFSILLSWKFGKKCSLRFTLSPRRRKRTSFNGCFRRFSKEILTKNEVRKFNTQGLKAITAGDPIQLEMKGQNPFTDVITCKLFFAVNSLPIASDKTFAYMRRAQIIPFLAKFVDNPDPNKPEELKCNPNIKDKLLKELSGIFHWAMRRLRRLINQDYNFTHSEKADEVLALYVREINPVCDFTNEVIEANKKSEVTQDSLYNAYSIWAKKEWRKSR